MDKLMRIAALLAKRPSDMTIRIVRILYALLLAAVLGLGFYDYTLSLWGYWPDYGAPVKYALFAVPVFWLVWGVSPVCLMKRKTAQRVMLLLGGVLVILSIVAIDPAQTAVSTAAPAATASGAASYEDIVNGAAKTPASVSTPAAASSSTMPVALLVFFFGLGSLALGATSKFVTSGCLKYKEKITVIRV